MKWRFGFYYKDNDNWEWYEAAATIIYGTIRFHLPEDKSPYFEVYVWEEDNAV